MIYMHLLPLSCIGITQLGMVAPIMPHVEKGMVDGSSTFAIMRVETLIQHCALKKRNPTSSKEAPK